MFNIENLDTETKQEAGAWLHLVDPSTGDLAYSDKEEKKPCRIKLKGYQSLAGKEFVVNSRNDLIKKAVENGKKKDKKDQPKELTLDDLKENALSDAATLRDLAIDWENICDGEGKEIKFTKEAFYNCAVRMLDLRKQCLEFIQDQKSFFEK